MRDEERIGQRGGEDKPPPRKYEVTMDSAETSNQTAPDSDGSISWEEFIGTTTDLVPQLLGMFDEIARRKSQQQQNVSASLQKRLSLVQQNRKSRYDMAPQPNASQQLVFERYGNTPTTLVEGKSDSPRLIRLDTYASPTQLRYSARQCQGRQTGSRPVSSSSVASSTSSSGCSNGPGCNASGTTNPYLASVESLADTCASSQGSGDSGVVTISESSGGDGRSGSSGGGASNVGKESSISKGGSCYLMGKIRLNNVDRTTTARYIDEHGPRYCEPQRSPVERVLLEIVDTEAVYVEHLRQIIQGYLIFWRDDPTSLIRDLELSDLFSNIEDIFEFNRKFLSSLEKCRLDPIAVANTFIEQNSGFKVYTEYCTNYPRTVSILTDLMGQEEISRAFRERQVALSHALPLGSFLLKPVQRILKYHLLLENLSKEFEAYVEANTCADLTNEHKTSGKAAIEGALQAMTGIAQHINAMKRKHEHAVRVQEIQSLLYGWPGPDLTTSGELIAEGSFRMRGAKAPRHAFLFDRMLLLTKRREDGLLVYKAHILCSNLTLMESIPGEPLSFHVIPFDNSQLQYKLQARNLEQKREWTLQIKRVILENYNAVIPSHARQLVLQIGQNKCHDTAMQEQEKNKSIDNMDNRKADRQRRRSETGLRQKLRKGKKSDVCTSSTAEYSPMSSRKNQSAESIHFESRDENLNRSSDIRGSKIKDRFWRRKSEPGFQSYINLNPSDNEDDKSDLPNDSTTPTQDVLNKHSKVQTESEKILEPSTSFTNLDLSKTKGKVTIESKENSQESCRYVDIQDDQHSHDLKSDEQRFAKNVTIDSSDEEEYSDNEEKTNGVSSNSSNKRSRSRFSRREQCYVKTINGCNQRSFRFQYDSFRNVDTADSSVLHRQNSAPIVKSTFHSSNQEKHSASENFKKPNFLTDSKVIKIALRIRENRSSTSEHEDCVEHEEHKEHKELVKPISEPASFINNDIVILDEGNSGSYDNLEHVWNGCLESDTSNIQDYPTKAAVWLTKLCEGLPDQPQKCGSLPRSFQMMLDPANLDHVSKARFLQRDGKSMTERPFTIASDQPAEINLEDMERYVSTCQGSARIAKFPITASSSTSSSMFFCSLDDASFTDTDSMSRVSTLSTSTHIHPDHKIYRANGSSSREQTIGTASMNNGSGLRSVLSKAGSRLQGLRSSQSTETLECSEDTERTRYFRSFSKRNKKTGSGKSSKEPSFDFEDMTSCGGGSKLRLDQLPYHKQGSPSLGARIAQSDYADPTILFAESRRNLNNGAHSTQNSQYEAENKKEVTEKVFKTGEESIEILESDSFYERSFEVIENYVEDEAEEAYRDSAIFSDVDDSDLKPTNTVMTTEITRESLPPMPKQIIGQSVGVIGEKPTITQKPAHLKLRARIVKCRGLRITPTKTTSSMIEKKEADENEIVMEDDVSAGQSQVGWVKKMVGQLQAQVDA